MKKPIITIERQYGSGGSVIGNLVAEKLGINCYNRQILKMTAERCGIAVKNLENAEENVPTSFLYSLLLSANPARTMEENLPLSDKVFIMESRIINEIAEQESSIQKNQEGMSNLEESRKQDDEFVKFFEAYGNIQQLDREIIAQLLDHIVYHDPEHMEIYFRFSDVQEKIYNLAVAVAEQISQTTV